MPFDPIGKPVGHTINASGDKVEYKNTHDTSFTKANQLGEEFVSFLKNDTNAADDQLLSKQEATDGFKAFLKAKYTVSDACIDQFLPDFEASWKKSFDAWQGANAASIENGNVKFSSLVNKFDSDIKAEYVQYTSFQFMANDETDNTKDGVFQKIVNLSTTQNSLCEAGPVPPPPAPAPPPIQPITAPVPAKITTLTLAGLNGSLEQATGVFTVSSGDTYANIARRVG